MGYSKRQVVEGAFEEIGIAAYVFDVTADETQSALRKLDSMMALWNSKGIRIGYSLPTSPNDSDPDDASFLPDSAVEAVRMNLALRLAPGFGKTINNDMRLMAREAYNALLMLHAKPIPMLATSLPLGAGNKPWRYSNSEFFPTPATRIDAGPDSELEFNP